MIYVCSLHLFTIHIVYARGHHTAYVGVREQRGEHTRIVQTKSLHQLFIPFVTRILQRFRIWGVFAKSLSFFCLYPWCRYVHVRFRACVGGHRFPCVCFWRYTMGVFFNRAPPDTPRQHPPAHPGCWFGFLAIRPQGASGLWLPSTEATALWHCTCLFIWFCGNSVSFSCVCKECFGAQTTLLDIFF